MKLVIIGGGIGGLALALSAHAAGFECEVYEATPEIRGLGVGINVLPHSIKELDDLGLLPALDAAGVRCERLVYITRGGDNIWAEPRGMKAGYRWPQVSIHRGRLQLILLEAVRARLGADAVRTGHQAVRAETGARGAIVHFVRRDSGEALPPAEADLVVAADGIHSAIRAQHFPQEGAPKWGGMVLWRGTTVAAPFLGGNTMMISGNRHAKFVCYPIRHLPDGRQLINWIADLEVGASSITSINDWNRRGRIEDFLPAYARWGIRDVDIAGLVHGAEAIYEYPMSDRDALPGWVFGRVCLLGDAAHAMYPIGSNGASQAILDARRLVLELATRPDIDSALAAYEAARRPPMERLLMAHRADGPDVILDMLEERAPQGYGDLETVLPMREREEIALRYKKMAGFDVDTLNTTPPLAPPRAR